MITKLFVVQQIIDGRVEVFQMSGDNFQWTYHARRTRITSDPAFFPFHVNGDYKIWKREAGDETILVVKENEIIFCDDYGVPGGTVIGILFPKGYVPDVIKFKDTPYIPVNVDGLVSTRSPGYLQVLYNFQEKRSAVVFSISDNIVFGFKCVARKIADDLFPRNESLCADHLFDVSISRDFLNIKAIKNEDLKIINQTLAHTDIDQIKTDMNRLLTALQAGDNVNSKKILNRISNILTIAAGNTSALVTIADSYRNGNSAFKFIHQILEYTNL